MSDDVRTASTHTASTHTASTHTAAIRTASTISSRLRHPRWRSLCLCALSATVAAVGFALIRPGHAARTAPVQPAATRRAAPTRDALPTASALPHEARWSPTDNDLPYEESFGQGPGLDDAPFEGPANNGTIGIGGGAGGAFARRCAHREQRTQETARVSTTNPS